MEIYGLVGASLSHSFSPKFFSRYFIENKINATYELFEISEISNVSKVFAQLPNGLNVTIPYKESIVPFLDLLDNVAEQIGAVNTIVFSENKKIGYNTDVIGFRQSIKPFLTFRHERALIIGTGGAAKAVAWTLRSIGIDVIYISRSPEGRSKTFAFSEINNHMVNACKLIVNCTPVGMFPNASEILDFPYDSLTEDHLVIDLIYNPLETNFLKEAKQRGATTLNGEGMLKQQALASWELWRGTTKV